LRIAALAARSLFFLLVMVCFLYAMSDVRVVEFQNGSSPLSNGFDSPTGLEPPLAAP
jgi:hypothetical protein